MKNKVFELIDYDFTNVTKTKNFQTFLHFFTVDIKNYLVDRFFYFYYSCQIKHNIFISFK